MLPVLLLPRQILLEDACNKSGYVDVSGESINTSSFGTIDVREVYWFRDILLTIEFNRSSPLTPKDIVVLRFSKLFLEQILSLIFPREEAFTIRRNIYRQIELTVSSFVSLSGCCYTPLTPRIKWESTQRGIMCTQKTYRHKIHTIHCTIGTISLALAKLLLWSFYR